MITRPLTHPAATATSRPSPAVEFAWDGDAPPSAEPRRLLSLYAPAPAGHAAAFVRAAGGQERFYWAEPGDGLVLAGAGLAAQLVSPPVLADNAERLPEQRFSDIEAQARRLFTGALLRPADETRADAALAALARPRLFGGFAFQDDFVPDNTWSVFNPAEFLLPHYQYAQAGDRACLTINALLGPGEDPDEALRGLVEALRLYLAAAPTHIAAPIGPTRLRYPMTAAQWAAIIGRAVAAIRAGALDKVVLARVCEVWADTAIDATAPLAALDAGYGDSYRFLFEPQPGHAFLGATPELLVSKSGRAVATMALAGSVARGGAPAADDALAAQLLASTKDRQEHEYVVAAIRAQLAEATDALDVPTAPAVLRLRNIQHLHTPIRGQLRRPDDSILRLVRRLHPTPAMGGVPRERALAFLRDAEPFPRGWYAAPIGWFDGALDGVFAVGIRSAVTQHARAWLYAGAGIVAQSAAEREWDETALKFRPMLGALGAEEIG